MTQLTYSCGDRIFSISMPDHAGSHEWNNGKPGSDLINVYPRMFTMLRSTVIPGSVLIAITPFYYLQEGSWVVFAGGTYNLTPHIPADANNVRLVLLGLNTLTNTIQAYEGTPSFDSALTPPPAPTGISDTFIPSALVRVKNGVTALSEVDVSDARVLLGGTGGQDTHAWPLSGENLLGTTNYASVALLLAGMTAGDIGYLGSRVSNETVVHNVDDATLQGVDADAVVFTNPLDFSSNFFTYKPKLVNVSVSVESVGTYAVKLFNDVDVVNVKVRHEDVDNAKGFYSNGTSARLINCESRTNGYVTSHACYATDFGTLEVHGGTYIASGTGNVDFYADTNATIELFGPVCSGNFGGPGTIKGYYFTTDGNLRFANGTTLQNGVWLLRASTKFRIYYDTYALAYAAAVDGDTIQFGHGTYPFTTANNIIKSITIEGLGPDKTILTGSNDGPTFYSSTTDEANTIVLRNLTIRNTGSGTSSGAFLTDQSGVILDNVYLEKVSGSPTNGYALHATGGSITLINDCRLKSTAGTNKYGLLNLLTSATTIVMHGGRIEGTTQDIYSDTTSTITLIDTILANSLVSWGTRRGHYVNSTGQLVSFSSIFTATGTDIFPSGSNKGLNGRLIDRVATTGTVEHFRSGSLPAGWTWASYSPLVTPSNIIYTSSEYIGLTHAGATKGFLKKAITSGAGNWQNKASWGRFTTGLTTEIGLRVDDGTDANYAELYVTGVLGNATLRVDFRYRTANGTPVPVASGVIIPAGEFVTLYMLCYWSGSQYFFYGYLIGEHGSSLNISGFNTPAITWPGGTGNWGIFAANAGNHGFCDLFSGTYT